MPSQCGAAFGKGLAEVCGNAQDKGKTQIRQANKKPTEATDILKTENIRYEKNYKILEENYFPPEKTQGCLFGG